MFENKNYFDLKSKSVYPKILNDEIKLLSFNSENSVLIGSASYKIQKYPADIDLYEQVKTCCSKEDAIEYFYLGIKGIVNDIRLKQNHWMIEVKCGLDDRYDIIDLGYNMNSRDLIDFLNESESIISYSDLHDLKELYKELVKVKLGIIVTAKPYTIIIDQIINIIRNYRIIRWSSDQIEMGEQVRYGKKFYLKDCIDTHSPINIEVIAIVDGKFTDLSNFYVLMFYDKITGKDVVINFPQEYLTDGKQFVINGLEQGINKVLFSEPLDVFKGIKRMFSLARLTNNSKLFKRIQPIISSDLAQLSQLKSELATIHEILEFTDALPWAVVYKQLEEIRWKLGGNVFLKDIEIEELSNRIQHILDNRNDIVFMKDTIEDIRKYLLKVVNIQAAKYLRRAGLYKRFEKYIS